MAAPASPAALPAVLPVFPLTGSLLLPGNWLPLNVFEPRYRNLVEDATGAGGGTLDPGGAGDAGKRRAGGRRGGPRRAGRGEGSGRGAGGERGSGGGRGAGGGSESGPGGSGEGGEHEEGSDEGHGGRGGRWIGMIQPRVPHQDNWPALDEPPANPELYTVGCAGRIERCEPQPDGRYLVLLKGVSRFRVRGELALLRGYRRVAVDFAEFAADLLEPAAELDPAPLLRAVREFGQAQGLAFDLDVLASLPGVALLNGLAVALPFRPAEKQALLEADGPRDRQRILLALMGMGVEPLDPGDYYAPPKVH